MPSLGTITKYLGLFSLGKGFIDKVVLQKLLHGFAAVLGLAVVAAILTGTIIVGLLALIYYSLVSYTEINEVGALAIVGGITLLLIGLLVYKILEAVKKISSVSAVMLQTSVPSSPLAPVTDVVNAFLDGLKSERKPKSKYPRPVK